MASRVYVPVTTREYARIYGVSERTARRRITESEGSFRTGTRLRALVPATEYARRTHTSVKRVRARNDTVRGPDPLQLAFGLTTPTLRQQATEARYAQVQAARHVSVDTIYSRMGHASTRQKTMIINGSDPFDEDMDGDDEIPLGYYH